MNRDDLTRRALVRRSLAIAAGGALAANLATTARSVAQEASPEAGPMIALDLLGGDVWAWEKRLTGTCAGLPTEAVIALRVNDDLVPTERDGDAFAATVKLQPGENRVVAVATVPNGPLMESAPVIHTVQLTPRPIARIALTIEGNSITADGRGSEPSEYDGAAIARYHWATRAGNSYPEWSLEGSDTTASEPLPVLEGEYYLTLTVEDAEGRTDTATSYFVVEQGKARIPDPVAENAAWIAPATVYGVVPRLFGSPPIKSVTQRLDDLKDLGVAALWLSPINTTIPQYFGYEVKDYFDVRTDYGTLDDVRELVAEAHAHGIRVLMDFVPNHTSEQHPYFQDAQKNGTASPYYDFYDRNDGGGYTYYFGWTHLPNLNYDNPEVRRFMTEAFTYWVREIGIDGFRVDVAWGIKERRPDYWLEWSAELNRIKPDSLLIAEASARDPFYVANGFDAAYDWTDELGHWAWGDAFGSVAPMGDAMEAVLTNDGVGYPPDSLVFHFLNNNDTGARFVTSYGVDFYRTAAALLLTLPGLPCVYTGDEIGAEYEPYGQIGPIDWTDTRGLRDYFTKLISLRREYPSLHSREWLRVPAEPSLPLFAYLRFTRADDPPMLAVLNFSAEDIDATIAVPKTYRSLAEARTMTDLMSDQRLSVTPADFKVMVPAWGVRILSGGEG
ncbi:MAG TPA: alpha-amylase family glycosyl hydrolase [Thermomicrobiales bacterium]|nr:alpha-amylase family glycosyl hydrolase [Thermomicrobiales bacterium]